MPRDWRAAAGRRAILPAVLLIAGLAIVFAGADIVGWTVFAVGLTVALALVFLEIGYSEDRARAREAERDRRD